MQKQHSSDAVPEQENAAFEQNAVRKDSFVLQQDCSRLMRQSMPPTCADRRRIAGGTARSPAPFHRRFSALPAREKRAE